MIFSPHYMDVKKHSVAEYQRMGAFIVERVVDDPVVQVRWAAVWWEAVWWEELQGDSADECGLWQRNGICLVCDLSGLGLKQVFLAGTNTALNLHSHRTNTALTLH